MGERDVPSFTATLRWAFTNIPGPDGRLLTTERFVSLIPEQGVPGVEAISISYGNQLRSGAKANPSAALLTAISRVFAVPTDFWWDEAVQQVVRDGVVRLADAADLRAGLAAAHRTEELAERIAGRSPHGSA